MDSRHSRIHPLKSFATWASVALFALILSACQTPARQFSDADVRAEYDRATEKWLANTRGQFEYKVRHLMVRSKEDADAALARIRAGESFSAVATEVSLDRDSRKKGGEISDWNLASNFTPNFAAAVKALDPAGLSKSPVQTPFGWHVIEVTDKRLPEWPAFDQIKDQLAEQLRTGKTRN